jgi:hypothetical protein
MPQAVCTTPTTCSSPRRSCPAATPSAAAASPSEIFLHFDVLPSSAETPGVHRHCTGEEKRRHNGHRQFKHGQCPDGILLNGGFKLLFQFYGGDLQSVPVFSPEVNDCASACKARGYLSQLDLC